MHLNLVDVEDYNMDSKYCYDFKVSAWDATTKSSRMNELCRTAFIRYGKFYKIKS